MLSTRQIQEHIAKITYKPGWAFEVYDGAWEGQHLVIRTEVEDAYHPGQTTTLDVHSPLPPMPTPWYLDVYLQWRVNRIETHEAREFMRRNGRPVFDPHTDAGNRDVIEETA